MKLTHTSIIASPFCDYLNVTLPIVALEQFTAQLEYLFDMAGMSSYDNGSTYQADTKSGALKITHKVSYFIVSASGGILQHFRDLGLFNEYISILSEYPHKITRLDATADFNVPYAPDTMKFYKKASRASKLRLTRKILDQANIKFYLGLNTNGDETGTIYLGDRGTHSVFGKIYDKTFERITRGFVCDAQIVRVELTLKNDTGISLRDAHNPENVFYHYASHTLVEPPPHFTGWIPNVTGYVLPRQPDLFTPAGRILNIFKFSTELGKAMRLAITAYGDEALDVLITQLKVAFRLKSTVNI